MCESTAEREYSCVRVQLTGSTSVLEYSGEGVQLCESTDERKYRCVRVQLCKSTA